MEGYVKLEYNKEHKAAEIEFYHPKGNSLPSALLHELSSAIKKAGENINVNSILIRSYGEKVFCAGASFDELLSIDDEKNGEEFFSGFAGVINAIRKAPKFVVGEVQGKTVGGGVGLASAFDYCLATGEASVKLSELSIGIGPFVIAPAVKRKIGISAFSELSLNASQWHDAQWAANKGLYNSVHNSKEEMQIASNALIESFSAYGLQSIEEMKRELWDGTDHWEELLYKNAAVSGKLVLSDFTKAKLRSFKTKH